MIFSGRQQRILAEIEDRLRRESPELLAKFALFDRLVRDEGPPPRR